MSYLPTGKELIDPFKVLEAAGTSADMKVADFGCGTLGHYVFAAAKVVGPGGRVYAIDILKSVLSGIESMIRLERLTNVETIWGDLERPNGVKLTDDVLDVGLLVNNLYLSKKHAEMMHECIRPVKRGSMFVLVDWKPGVAQFGPEQSTRVSAENALRLGIDAGLELVKEFSPGPYHYGYVFKKP